MLPPSRPQLVRIVCAAASLLLSALAAPAQAQIDCTTRVPACQTAPNPNSAPSVIISPSRLETTSTQVTVTINWSDDSGLQESTRAVFLDGTTDVTSAFTWTPTTVEGTVRAATSTATLTLSQGEHLITARINDATSQGSASATITVLPPPVGPRVAPLVSLAPHHSGFRDVAPGSATYKYASPSYVSLDQERSLGLTYAGGMARPFGFVQVDVTDGSQDPPTKMSIQLFNLDGSRVTFRGDLQEIFYTAGPGTNRLAAQFEASDRASAAYAFDVVVRSWRADGTFVEAPSTPVRIPIINRKSSVYGAGWAVSDLQSLVNQGDGVFVMDGSVGLWFAKGACAANGNCEYTSPDGDFTRMTWNNAQGVWERRFKNESLLRFGSNGVMLDARDRFQNVTSFGYDGAGRLTTITDPAGLVSHYSYHPDNPASGGAAGHLAWFEDPMGRRTVVETSGPGELFRIWNPAGKQVLQAYYFEQHLMAYYYDWSGGMNSFYYDYGNFTVNGVELPWVQADSGWVRPSAGQRSRESAVLNQTGVNGWAGAPAPYRRSEDVRLSTWNARGTHTDVAVDRFGNPTLVEAPLGLVTTIERDAVTGLPTLVKSTAGSQATYRWDERGNLLYAIDPRSGVATVTEYDPVFDLPKRVQRGRGVLRYRYGAQGELLSATMSGDSTVYTYDTRGRLRTSEDMGGHEVQITYEPGGFQNTATVTRPGANGPQTDTYAYDGYGRTRAVRAANGDSTAVAYDVLNRRISATDPAGRTTTFGYTREHLTRVTDPTGQSYFSRVNALGWKQADSIPGRPNAYLGYDRLGNVTSSTDRRGSTVTVTHDALGRVLTRTADGQTTTYAYDNPNNRWIAAANAESTDTLYYDESHRLRSKVSVLGANRYELRYAHTVEGTLLSVSLNATLAQGVALTRSVTYRPDGRLRPYAIEDLSGQETTIRFNADGQASSITFPTGLQQTFTYTPSHLPETANWNNGTVQASLGASYTYDLRDRLVAGPQRGPAANRTQRTYQYDRSNQLIGFQDQSITTRTVCSPLPCRIVVDTTTSHMPSESYSYDHAGNRTDRGATLEPGSNRYATFDNYLFQYDNEGNLLRKVKPGYDDLTLTWNSLGQVASASRYQRGTVQYGYNGFGERVRRTSSDGTVIRFLYDRDDLFMELDGAGSPIREYTYYPGIDRPHSVRVTATNTKYYYNMEMPGHVTGLVDGAGTVVNKYDYTPFGSATTATEGVEQPLGYMGRELDRVSGLYYVRARWYDPEQGRFLSEDPIGLAGGMNMYAYVDNNPTNFTDPTGFCRRWIVELTTFYSDGTSETHIIGYIWVGCDDQSKSNGGGSGGAGPRDESLTRREHDRLRCVVNGYLVEPARSTFLNMLSQQLVVSGTRSPPAIAWADLPFHGPQRIIFAPGAKGAIASFQPPQLAQTVGHEVRHVYQGQTFSAMFALMGLGRAEYTAFMSSPVVRDWQEADAYAHQNQYVRTDISRGPNCPTLD